MQRIKYVLLVAQLTTLFTHLNEKKNPFRIYTVVHIEGVVSTCRCLLCNNWRSTIKCPGFVMTKFVFSDFFQDEVN